MPNEEIDRTIDMPSITVVTTEPGALAEEEPGGGNYGPFSTNYHTLHEFALEVTHEWEEGVQSAPRAGPAGTPVAVWRSHGGQCIRVVTWAATAIDGNPPAPHPAVLCPNDILKSKILSTYSPGVLPTGLPVVRQAGCYRYILQYTPSDDDLLMAASNPAIITPAASNYVSINSFPRDLLAAVNPAAYGTSATLTG